MTEEPYRWLEAISNRREYVLDQLRGGTPVLALSLPEGVLMAGVGTGQSKVFEIFDRQMGGAFGHPADVERLRQSAIDAAHLEGFTRAPEDVALRRLVGFGLSPWVKGQFEQLFTAPVLVEWLFAELGEEPSSDVLMRLHFHGGYRLCEGRVGVAAPNAEQERAAEKWLGHYSSQGQGLRFQLGGMLQAWWMLSEGKVFGPEMPSEEDRIAGWKAAVRDKVLEIALLDRASGLRSRVRWISPGDFEL